MTAGYTIKIALRRTILSAIFAFELTVNRGAEHNAVDHRHGVIADQ